MKYHRTTGSRIVLVTREPATRKPLIVWQDSLGEAFPGEEHRTLTAVGLDNQVHGQVRVKPLLPGLGHPFNADARVRLLLLTLPRWLRTRDGAFANDKYIDWPAVEAARAAEKLTAGGAS